MIDKIAMLRWIASGQDDRPPPVEGGVAAGFIEEFLACALVKYTGAVGSRLVITDAGRRWLSIPSH